MAMTEAQMAARIAELEAQVAAKSALRFKVSTGGGVQVVGMRGKWGVTFYVNEWETIFENKDKIESFIKANKAALSTGKDDPRFQHA